MRATRVLSSLNHQSPWLQLPLQVHRQTGEAELDFNCGRKVSQPQSGEDPQQSVPLESQIISVHLQTRLPLAAVSRLWRCCEVWWGKAQGTVKPSCAVLSSMPQQEKSTRKQSGVFASQASSSAAHTNITHSLSLPPFFCFIA